MGVQKQTCLNLRIRLDVMEILRILGRDAAFSKPQQRTLVERLLGESVARSTPKAVFTVYPVESMSDNQINLQGCPTVRGPIAGYLRPARRVASFVVTIGDWLEQSVDQRLRSGLRMESYILNTIGSVALEAAIDALADEIYFEHASPKESLTPPFSPGFCGLSLEEQIPIFTMVDAGAIDVRLLPDMTTLPRKSISGLIGMGPTREIENHGIPCHWCDLKTCGLRNHVRS